VVFTNAPCDLSSENIPKFLLEGVIELCGAMCYRAREQVAASFSVVAA